MLHLSNVDATTLQATDTVAGGAAGGVKGAEPPVAD
jgi:hypothetical protein